MQVFESVEERKNGAKITLYTVYIYQLYMQICSVLVYFYAVSAWII